VPTSSTLPAPHSRRERGLVGARPSSASDRDLSDLVGELATQSEAFRIRWAAHDVRFHNTGVKQFHHPVVGELSLSYNRLDLAADHGLTIFTYAAEPGSRSEEALNLLGSWAATIDSAESARPTDRSDAERDAQSA
jgi:MmyB-like transcription regulator ligand binding domain